MKIETITLNGFRCFGSEPVSIEIEPGITTFVGSNGAGKTAVLLALSRMFGVTSSQRSVKVRDFHISNNQESLESGAKLSIDVVFGFPELDEMSSDDIGNAVPEFFLQMAASAPGEPLKTRMVLRATWIDDGTIEGSIEEDLRWVRSLEEIYDWDNDCRRVVAAERGTIQMIYVPAVRDVERQVTALLKGRLWKAARWSEKIETAAGDMAEKIQRSFLAEKPAKIILKKLGKRWGQVHYGDTDSKATLRLVDQRLDELVRNAEFVFCPDEAGNEKTVSDLSDGQRSMFQIALTAATLEVERNAFGLSQDKSAFDHEKLHCSHLTILAVEEPENSLSPFFLSRILVQAREIGELDSAQVLLSSHSASMLARVEPEEVRYFRLRHDSRTSTVRSIVLPEDDLEAAKYVRLAVKAFPELYFARFVILGEGDSERIVIPRIADAMGVALDPSFVPIVPLGGRYCMHFWKLLTDLDIEYATLLDFDIGRKHGGANLVREIVDNLQSFGIDLTENSKVIDGTVDLDDLECLRDKDVWRDHDKNGWVLTLEEEGVFLSDPLDLDFAMLSAFPDAYQEPVPGGRGPGTSAVAIKNAKTATVKAKGDAALYEDDFDDVFRWYSYLFLNHEKPDSHLAALSRLTVEELNEAAPPELKSLIRHVAGKLEIEVDE